MFLKVRDTLLVIIIQPLQERNKKELHSLSFTIRLNNIVLLHIYFIIIVIIKPLHLDAVL